MSSLYTGESKRISNLQYPTSFLVAPCSQLRTTSAMIDYADLQQKHESARFVNVDEKYCVRDLEVGFSFQGFIFKKSMKEV